MTCPIPPSDLGTTGLWQILPLVAITVIVVGIYHEAYNPDIGLIQKIMEISLGVLMIAIIGGIALQMYFGIGC
jgi:hypothetical protein